MICSILTLSVLAASGSCDPLYGNYYQSYHDLYPQATHTYSRSSPYKVKNVKKPEEDSLHSGNENTPLFIILPENNRVLDNSYLEPFYLEPVPDSLKDSSENKRCATGLLRSAGGDRFILKQTKPELYKALNSRDDLLSIINKYKLNLYKNKQLDRPDIDRVKAFTTPFSYHKDRPLIYKELPIRKSQKVPLYGKTVKTNKFRLVPSKDDDELDRSVYKNVYRERPFVVKPIRVINQSPNRSPNYQRPGQFLDIYRKRLESNDLNKPFEGEHLIKRPVVSKPGLNKPKVYLPVLGPYVGKSPEKSGPKRIVLFGENQDTPDSDDIVKETHHSQEDDLKNANKEQDKLEIHQDPKFQFDTNYDAKTYYDDRLDEQTKGREADSMNSTYLSELQNNAVVENDKVEVHDDQSHEIRPNSDDASNSNSYLNKNVESKNTRSNYSNSDNSEVTTIENQRIKLNPTTNVDGSKGDNEQFYSITTETENKIHEANRTSSLRSSKTENINEDVVQVEEFTENGLHESNVEPERPQIKVSINNFADKQDKNNIPTQINNKKSKSSNQLDDDDNKKSTDSFDNAKTDEMIDKAENHFITTSNSSLLENFVPPVDRLQNSNDSKSESEGTTNMGTEIDSEKKIRDEKETSDQDSYHDYAANYFRNLLSGKIKNKDITENGFQNGENNINNATDGSGHSSINFVDGQFIDFNKLNNLEQKSADDTDIKPSNLSKHDFIDGQYVTNEITHQAKLADVNLTYLGKHDFVSGQLVPVENKNSVDEARKSKEQLQIGEKDNSLASKNESKKNENTSNKDKRQYIGDDQLDDSNLNFVSLSPYLSDHDSDSNLNVNEIQRYENSDAELPSNFLISSHSNPVVDGPPVMDLVNADVNQLNGPLLGESLLSGYNPDQEINSETDTMKVEEYKKIYGKNVDNHNIEPQEISVVDDMINQRDDSDLPYDPVTTGSSTNDKPYNDNVSDEGNSEIPSGKLIHTLLQNPEIHKQIEQNLAQEYFNDERIEAKKILDLKEMLLKDNQNDDDTTVLPNIKKEDVDEEIQTNDDTSKSRTDSYFQDFPDVIKCINCDDKGLKKTRGARTICFEINDDDKVKNPEFYKNLYYLLSNSSSTGEKEVKINSDIKPSSIFNLLSQYMNATHPNIDISGTSEGNDVTGLENNVMSIEDLSEQSSEKKESFNHKQIRRSNPSSGQLINQFPSNHSNNLRQPQGSGGDKKHEIETTDEFLNMVSKLINKREQRRRHSYKTNRMCGKHKCNDFIARRTELAKNIITSLHKLVMESDETEN